MLIHEKEHLLNRLGQNAQALAVELRKEHEGETVDADKRPALITKLRAKIREDVATLGLDTDGGAA